MEQTSRTRKKNAALALQELGERLVKLSNENIKLIDLPVALHQAVLLAKALKKHGPRDRQMQYIGALMRKCDPLPIQEALQRIEQRLPKRTPARRKQGP
ncbi:MAG: protein yjgA [Nitrospirae bacterium]|nr:protein yjgA [Nitrospirota bacterium]